MRTSMILPMMFIATLTFAGKIISIEDAIKKKLVHATIKGKGGHVGDVIRLKLKNLSGRSVSVEVEAGRRLDSENQRLQDILVNKTMTLALQPNQTRTFLISGMCCQAHNAGPDSNAVFSVGEMADSGLIKLAEFIDKNKWHKNSTAQSAVWVISDNNPMEDIGGYDTISRTLQRFVSKLTGKPIPKYKLEYAQQDGGAVYSGVPARIKGVFDYEIFSNGLVTFGIYDAQGHAVQMFFVDKPRSKGSYVFSYEFNTTNLPKGEYFARFRFDGQLKKEEKFVF